MTSASNPAPVLDTGRIDAAAERIATNWGHHGHRTLAAMITELYTELAPLPTHYTPHHRAAIITDAAGHHRQRTDHPARRPHPATKPTGHRSTDHGWVMHTVMHTDDRHHAPHRRPRHPDRRPPQLVAHDQLRGLITDREDDDFD